jgi:hypothetical protein
MWYFISGNILIVLEPYLFPIIKYDIHESITLIFKLFQPIKHGSLTFFRENILAFARATALVSKLNMELFLVVDLDRWLWSQ